MAHLSSQLDRHFLGQDLLLSYLQAFRKTLLWSFGNKGEARLKHPQRTHSSSRVQALPFQEVFF